MIGTADYRIATDTLAESMDLGRDSLPFLLNMRSDLLNADVNTNDRYRVQLRSMIEATYAFIVDKHISSTKRILDVVRAFNTHVLKHYKYDNLDEFLIEQFLEVPVTYAELSVLAGFPVTEIGDAAARFQDIDASWEDINIRWSRIGWHNL